MVQIQTEIVNKNVFRLQIVPVYTIKDKDDDIHLISFKTDHNPLVIGCIPEFERNKNSKELVLQFYPLFV